MKSAGKSISPVSVIVCCAANSFEVSLTSCRHQGCVWWFPAASNLYSCRSCGRDMITGWGLLAVSLAYVGALFAIAWWGDRTRLYPDNVRLRPVIYSLALAVYCSSWTFYGAVGSAVRDGLAYLPIYL